ncbi:unnamed protein product [Nezara viridula]|uniref:Uncharacterized protein n=1 Tax=Nezara viridula TaxID=85310 RepID=A0A9P0MZD2_NEZVI|nr:unnamed protein product [Nezara viridula]
MRRRLLQSAGTRPTSGALVRVREGSSRKRVEFTSCFLGGVTVRRPMHSGGTQPSRERKRGGREEKKNRRRRNGLVWKCIRKYCLLRSFTVLLTVPEPCGTGRANVSRRFIRSVDSPLAFYSYFNMEATRRLFTSLRIN